MMKKPIATDSNLSPTALKSLESYVKKSTIENTHTWYDLKEKEVNFQYKALLKLQKKKLNSLKIIQYFKEQDAQYLPIRKDIINSLNEIKVKLQELMNINTNRDELSKLKEHEFYLDLDELERLHKETDAEIQRVCLIFLNI